jgi:threonine synthase
VAVADSAVVCPHCDAVGDLRHSWRCTSCNGPWDLVDWLIPSPADLGAGLASTGPSWLAALDPVSLGEPVTPLVGLDDLAQGAKVYGKLEGSLPTGSFKDRGSRALVGWLRSVCSDHVAIDSSGNAGASMAAYCAAADVDCDVYVPATASAAKLAQIRAYGARVFAVDGSRSDVTEAAMSAGDVATYASHMWNPYFLVGTRTFAFEVATQLAATGSSVASVVFPLGSGSLLLGAYHGFRALLSAGLIARMPRLVGVQAAACAPLARSFTDAFPDGPCSGSIAEGILVAKPPRADAVTAAIAETGGTVVVVEEPEIASAHTQLARRGVYVEPTSATALAGLRRLPRSEEQAADGATILALTGSGLKSAAPPS